LQQPEVGEVVFQRHEVSDAIPGRGAKIARDELVPGTDGGRDKHVLEFGVGKQHPVATGANLKIVSPLEGKELVTARFCPSLDGIFPLAVWELGKSVARHVIIGGAWFGGPAGVPIQRWRLHI